MDPPTMLISVNRKASAHAAIVRTGRFCINLLDAAQSAHVRPFSDSSLRDRRFSGSDWYDVDQLPCLEGAGASILCRVQQTVSAGTHDLFVGLVLKIRVAEAASPLCWFDGAFAKVGAYEQ